MLSELKRSHPKLDVVLIATDSVGDAPQLLAHRKPWDEQGRAVGFCGRYAGTLAF